METLHVNKIVVSKPESSPSDVSEHPDDIEWFEQVLGIVLLVYSPFIIYCNTLVLFATVLYPGFHTPYNLHLFSLSFANLSMGVCSIPVYILHVFASTTFLIPEKKYACLGYWYLQGFSNIGSLQSMLFLAIDRYVAIACPFVYSKKVSMSITIRVLAGMWMYTVTLLSVPVLGMNTYDKNATGDKCAYKTIYPMWYQIWLDEITIVVCIVIPALLYIHIFIIAWRQRRTIRRLSGRTSSECLHFRKQMTSAKMSSAMMVLLVLLWLPALVTISFAERDQHLHTDNWKIWTFVATILVNATYVLNVLVYTIGVKEYRDVFKLMSTIPPWKWKKMLRTFYNERKSALFARSHHIIVKASRSTYPVTTETIPGGTWI